MASLYFFYLHYEEEHILLWDRREGGFRAAPSNVVTRALYAAGGKLIVTSKDLLCFVENSALAYTRFKFRYLRFQCCHDFSDGGYCIKTSAVKLIEKHSDWRYELIENVFIDGPYF
jgi:hypothetical protein